MKSLGYTEDRDVRCINTGAGLVETRKGDFVMVVVVRRWEDLPAELGRLAKLYTPGET
jgi:hypothetical protein